MTTNNQNKCDHTEAIAKEFYAVLADENAVDKPWKAWSELTDTQRNAIKVLAQKALPIIGKHALGDIKDYLGDKAAGESGIKKILLWLAAAVVGGLATLGLTGCGHDVTVAPGHSEICKDGACLVIDRDSQTITYRQDAGDPQEQPIVVQNGK